MSSDFEYLDFGVDFSKVKNMVLSKTVWDLSFGLKI